LQKIKEEEDFQMGHGLYQLNYPVDLELNLMDGGAGEERKGDLTQDNCGPIKVNKLEG
jgi:hypothetical protein